MKVCPDCRQTLIGWEVYCPKCSKELTGSNRSANSKENKKWNLFFS